MEVRPICINCNRKPVHRKRAANGEWRYNKKCDACMRDPEKLKERNKRKTGPQSHKKDHCEKCGFIPIVPFQLQVDHIDGNRANNDPANYQTLCANCHALKTWTMGDYRRGRKNLDPGS